jgi:hypothetical protein
MRCKIQHVLLILITVFSFSACKKKASADENQTVTTEPKLIFKFKFDESQVRLNNTGGVSSLPSNHRAQSPKINRMSAHYIELAQNDLTALGAGKILFHAPETTIGGTTAIDFNQSVRVGDGQEFFSIPLKNIGPGVYKWLRVSLAYQNYDIVFKNAAIPGNQLAVGTIASFVGYNTYISNYTIKNQTQTVNANKLQGYWGFETQILGQNYVQTGQSTSTTVVNPNFQNSPIPSGSCVVTAQFVKPGGLPSQLIIVGNEKQDIIVTVSLSTNNSFEWLETSNDNYFEPSAGDQVVDMGIRGMIPYWE